VAVQGVERQPVDRDVQAVAVGDLGQRAAGCSDGSSCSSAALTAAENRSGACITMSIMNTGR